MIIVATEKAFICNENARCVRSESACLRTDAGTSAPSAACFEPERSVLTVSRLRPRPSRLGNCPGRRGRRDLSVMAFGLIKERKVRKKSFFSFVLFFSRAYKHWGISVRFCTFLVLFSFLSISVARNVESRSSGSNHWLVPSNHIHNQRNSESML